VIAFIFAVVMGLGGGDDARLVQVDWLFEAIELFWLDAVRLSINHVDDKVAEIGLMDSLRPHNLVIDATIDHGKNHAGREAGAGWQLGNFCVDEPLRQPNATGQWGYGIWENSFAGSLCGQHGLAVFFHYCFQCSLMPSKFCFGKNLNIDGRRRSMVVAIDVQLDVEAAEQAFLVVGMPNDVHVRRYPSPGLGIAHSLGDDIGQAGLVKGQPDIDNPGDAEDQSSASDSQHGEGGPSHVLLGLEIGLLAFVIFSGAIGGHRSTRNAREMNLTHVIWWLIYFWFGSLGVTFIICLTILGQ